MLLATSAPGGERRIYDGELMDESHRPGVSFETRDGHDRPVAEVDAELGNAMVSRYPSLHEVTPVENHSEEADENPPAIPEDLDALPYRGSDDESGMNLQDLAQAHGINASQSTEDLISALADIRDGDADAEGGN